MAGALDGKVAAITGASSGIGEATALALAREGAALALGARREDRIRDLGDRIEADGGRALAIPVDVGDEASARGFVERAHSELGRLDVLVNNAGVMLLGPIEGADVEQWRTMVNVNVLGLLYCTHAALPLIREQGGGDIVNISSVAGRFAGPGSGVYNLTKFGVNAFSEALRQESVASKIRVIVVEPGYVETELQAHNENPVVREAIDKSREKIGKVLTAEDIADGIAYAVTRPQHVAINEILIRPAGQAR
jgi:NADP-dependent 3-hydroxy acid dehydrogenase YdfG